MAKKIKPVEVIDLGKLPKKPEVAKIKYCCSACGTITEYTEKYRNHIVACRHCLEVGICR